MASRARPSRSALAERAPDVLTSFHPAVGEWFARDLGPPTLTQVKGWPAILSGDSTLLLAPTGSGKTLAAFLAAIDRLMFGPPTEACQVIYVSPLKALAVDVERNLQRPLEGISAIAERDGIAFRKPLVGVRSGDTKPSERAKMRRSPPDVLITTPESLYLLLTSSARTFLEHVRTVIIDEIHSLVPTKRGAHLFLSLERLEAIRRAKEPLQRIGLSATQRPLAEVARLLGGGDVARGEEGWRPRPVRIVDASSPKALRIQVEVPLEDMTNLSEPRPKRAGGKDEPTGSIWPAIHPRLVELIRSHRSTMIFANSRRIAERLASSINDLAGEEIALAHHGSVALDRRQAIEDRLKRGDLPAIVATSSLELGIDMGAVDLVVQIEAPLSVASGIQRIGRAGHSVGAVSEGVIFPKYRGDLLACAAATAKMQRAEVEETFFPKNPLDVLAQQIVAIVAMDPIHEDDLFALVRRAAPFAELGRTAFDGVLDMLAGRYPSDEFSELRPRIVWDRQGGVIRGREGVKSLAILSGGTIPDRGLYGVYLSGDGGASSKRRSRRVGELDEEMVYESRVGDVFLLGASSWRIDEISHDRVLVSPAPGQPGKMPFWHGDRPGRSVEFGKSIGELARRLLDQQPAAAEKTLRQEHGLDRRASTNLLAYLRDQAAATGVVPSDTTILIERTRDDVGAYRVCVLSPLGGRVNAPWANAVIARARAERGVELQAIWSDDGIVFRMPDAEGPLDPKMFLPPARDIESLLLEGLMQTSLFAARFRENAARALLLPRRFPGSRSPLWLQRKRSSDLLAVASRYADFPILLETFRECLRDVFDVPALVKILEDIDAGHIRVVAADRQVPSPFAASVLFSYVIQFIYDADAPLAERRAHALTVDTTQLRELFGDTNLSDLIDPDAVGELEQTLQRLGSHRIASSPDAVHDLLHRIGALDRDEVAERVSNPERLDADLEALRAERRILEVAVGGATRLAAIEDASRYRDAANVALPSGIAAAFLEPVDDPLGDLVLRHARTHGPFDPQAIAERLGIARDRIDAALAALSARGLVVEGSYVRGAPERRWCDADVLRTLKRRSLSKLRKQVEPASGESYCRFLLDWHGIARPRRGLDALLGVIGQLQGAPLVVSALESDILPARIEGYRPNDLDHLCASGEVAWIGIDSIGAQDGRIALYLTEQLPVLAPPPRRAEGELAGRIRDLLAARGALFFSEIVTETGAFATDLLAALWELVWAGEVRNDTLAPLRSRLRKEKKERPRPEQRLGRPTLLASGRGFDRLGSGPPARRRSPPGSEGRWSLRRTTGVGTDAVSDTERAAGWTRSLLERYGVLVREAAQAEGIPGGFSAVYEVLKAMEETARVRRGYFVENLGATQFALPGADDRLRAMREPTSDNRAVILAATDPANPYGAALPWPESSGKPQRAAGSHVVLVQGRLVAYAGRGGRSLTTFLSDGPDRPAREREIAQALAQWVDQGKHPILLIADVDGEGPGVSRLEPALREAGFSSTIRGYFKRAAPRR